MGDGGVSGPRSRNFDRSEGGDGRAESVSGGGSAV